MKNGFTLLELIVVIAIIILFSGIVLANYRVGGRGYALLRSAQKLAQDIRRVEEMAISAKEFQGAYPEGGYGIYFSLTQPDRYFLFVDSDKGEDYDGISELVEEIKLESGIKIENLSSSPLTIIFTAPDPTVKIRPVASSGTITIASKENSKTIIVNTAGLIESD